jgi:hypothetical protein
MRHLVASGRILRLRRKAFTRGHLTPDPVFERLIAESVLYNITTLSIFNGLLIDDHSISDIAQHLDEFAVELAFPESSAIVNSPVLGISQQLYYAVLNVSRLSVLPFNTAKRTALESIRLDFDMWKVVYFSTCTVDYSNSDEVNAVTSAMLYVSAIEILLSKASDATRRTHDIEVQNLVRHALAILDLDGRSILKTNCTKYFAWPLLILGAAAIEEEHITLVQEVVREVWARSYCGEVYQVQRLLEKVWSTRSSSSDHTHCEHCDGLDLLWGRDGKPGLLNHTCPSD